MTPIGSLRPCTLALLVIGSTCAKAYDFPATSDVIVRWNTTATVGTGMRVEHPDPMLIKRPNGPFAGVPGAYGGGADDANLNYPDAGDTFSTVGKVFTDLRLAYRDYGVVVRAKGWYDERLEDHGVPHGHVNNGYAPGARLRDAGFEPEARFSGASLAAAFAYGRNRAGSATIDYRAGQQAVLSGIGTARFMRGLTINMPVDVPAFRRPGYLEPTLLPVSGSLAQYTHTVLTPELPHDAEEVKLWLPLGAQAGYWDPETPLPVGAVTAGVTLPNGMGVSGFWQYQWRASVFVPCGTFFTANDVNTDLSASGTCNAVELGQTVPGVGTITEQQALAQGRFIRMVDAREARDGGQYGANVWVPLPVGGNARPQLGLHYLHVHSTAPSLNGIRGAPGQLYDFQPTPVRGRWVYPEDVRTFGVTLRTAWPGKWLAAAEVSYTPNAPAQINPNDLLFGSVTAGSGPAGARVASVPIGAEVQGYDRVHKTQAIVNAGALIPPLEGDAPSWLRWTYGFAFAEVGAQWADLPGTSSGLRYGRAFMYGLAPAPGIPDLQTACVQFPGNAGCANEGYFTRFSWGYRVKAFLNFAAGEVDVKPTFTLAHDVQGYSIDNQLTEGRRSIEGALRFDWPRYADATKPRPLLSYFAEMKYVTYANRAKFDGLRDRDHVILSAGATF